MHKSHRGKEWYFNIPKSAGKYPNGKQPALSAGNEFWKARGADVVICDEQGINIGAEKTLVYYEGKVKEKKDIKTDWIMQEYQNEVNNTNHVSPIVKKDRTDMKRKDANQIKLDEWILCKGESNTMNVPSQNPNVDSFCMQQKEQERNPNKKQGGDDSYLSKTTSLLMQNVKLSDSNTKQGSYFDSSTDGLNGQDYEGCSLTDYEPGFHCFQNGCVYTQKVSIPEPLQTVHALCLYPPQAMEMCRDSSPMQNEQNSPEPWFSCFYFAHFTQ